MFDFKRLATSAVSTAPATLYELFSQLDRKATHASLRSVQVAALKALDAQLANKDLVLKLSTGSGKTVVGLVYAEMMRQRYRGEPVLYLCPTNQLVDQVFFSASSIGVPVSKFERSGIPLTAIPGENVLICTYDRLFNARSTFENHGVRPSCVVLDDVHAGVERVRQNYSAKVPTEYYDQLRALLRPLCEATDPGTWRGIENNAADARYEVPFWIWSAVSGQVSELLEKLANEGDLLFKWGNLSRYTDLARLCISGTDAELSLPVSAVEENNAYNLAKHRLFMSASIKDGAMLIADFACDPTSLERLIELPEDEGAGERMILPTSLISQDASKQDVALACAKLSRQANVVVLTSSTAQTREWKDAGASAYSGGEVDGAIELLRSTQHNYAAFAQRFDGVDLPDDACRVLVIDGTPSGERLCDQIDAWRQRESPENDIRTVNRFEQALGRAVRSSADYAAVLLVGVDIAAFIGKKSVIQLFETRTQVQIELGKELAKMGPGMALSDVIQRMVESLLTRDEGWKDAHRTRVRGVVPRKREVDGLTVHERVAKAFRSAWSFAKARNFQAAVEALRMAANDDQLHPVQKAEVLYKVATYLHKFDPAAAMDAYRAVFQINSDFPRPELNVDKRFTRTSPQVVAVCAYFSRYASANAALARLDEIRVKLSFGLPADTVEQGLFELGEALGLSASRPEKQTGRGPDVLWLFDDAGFCIEAKSEKTAPISKTDAAQLALSLAWCEQSVDAAGAVVLPVFATNVTTADRAEDVAFGPSILSEECLLDLCSRLRQLVVALSYHGPLFSEAAVVGKRLYELKLTGKQVSPLLRKF
jgi:hypothetical protein